MRIKYTALLIIFLMIFTGCATKRYYINRDIDNITAIKLTKESTPNLCSYRGKINVTFKGEQSVSFGGLLSKTCTNDILLNILGALNTPIAKIKYEKKELTVETASKEDSEALKTLANNYVFHINNFLSMPIGVLNNDFKLSFSNTGYVFTKENITITADDTFKINGYTTGDIKVNYIWEENYIKEVQVSSNKNYISIKFLNSHGWGVKK